MQRAGCSCASCPIPRLLSHPFHTPQARGGERPPSPGKRRREPAADLALEDLQSVSMDSAAAQVGSSFECWSGWAGQALGGWMDMPLPCQAGRRKGQGGELEGRARDRLPRALWSGMSGRPTFLHVLFFYLTSLCVLPAWRACPQLGKKERTLQEATSPPPLGRTSSDLLPSSDMELADGSATPRSRGSEQAAAWEQQQRLRGGRGRPRQPSNLGRQASAASSTAAAAGVPTTAAPAVAAAKGGAGRRNVPPLRLGLPLSLPDGQ